MVGRSLIPLDERLVALLLVLLLGSFCPLCLGQQRLSKSSSAAVADDDRDGDEDGNLKQCRTLAPVLQHHLSAARAWQVGSASRIREQGAGEGTCRPCADLTLAKQYKKVKGPCLQVDRHIPSLKREKLYPNNLTSHNTFGFCSGFPFFIFPPICRGVTIAEIIVLGTGSTYVS